MSDGAEDGSGSTGPGGRWRRWHARGGTTTDAPRRRRRKYRFLPSWRVALGSLLALIVLCCGLLVAGYLLVDIPEPRHSADEQSNVYLYSDGTLLARTGDVNREDVELAKVPEPVRHAVLAAEDRDFYSAGAVDPRAMLRAGWNMLRGEGRQSGSTITQQYVKNYYLDQEQTVTRKGKEFFIALKLDREMSRDEILEGYLNTSYFGRNSYGIQAAAEAYYDKDVEELNVAEGAYLAAVLNAPSAYDVGTTPDRRDQAVARWEYVVDGMVSEGWLSEREREEMEFPEPVEVSPPAGLSGQRGYVVEAVHDQLLADGVLEEEQLGGGGLRITTTIDAGRQEALTAAVQEQLLDQLDPEERSVDGLLRAGAASVDPATGEVVALYGGSDYTEQFTNGATRRDYQAASTFKPLVYAAALANESTNGSGETIGPETTYSGDSGREVIAQDGSGTGWRPDNESDRDYGDLSVSEAMNDSVNAVFAQIGEDVGAELIADTARALGLPEDTPGLDEQSSTIALGTATPSALDLAHAYATLAAHGERQPLTLVTEVTTDGEEVELPEPADPVQALERGTADAVTELLIEVVAEGTGATAASVGRPAAGKTGTAEEDKAAWFAGYTPDLATVVGVLGQDPESGMQESMHGALGQERINGSGPPAEIWAQYMAAALDGEPVREFELRSSVADDPDVSPSGGPSGGPSGDPSATASPGEESTEGPSDEDGTPDEEESPGRGNTGEPAQPSEPPREETPTGGGEATEPPGGDAPDPGDG